MEIQKKEVSGCHQNIELDISNILKTSIKDSNLKDQSKDGKVDYKDLKDLYFETDVSYSE